MISRISDDGGRPETDRARSTVVPAEQRLAADDRLVAEVEHRLVLEHELVPLDRSLPVVGDDQVQHAGCECDVAADPEHTSATDTAAMVSVVQFMAVDDVGQGRRGDPDGQEGDRAAPDARARRTPIQAMTAAAVSASLVIQSAEPSAFGT